MKKLVFVIFVFLLITTIFSSLSVAAAPVAGQVIINYFWGEGCPHCAEAKPFLDQLEKNKSNLEIRRYEVWNSKENAKLLGEVGRHLNVNIGGVPFFVIGDKYVVGFGSAETTGEQIKQLVEMCEIRICPDIMLQMGVLDNIIEPVARNNEINEKLTQHKINLPLFGEVSLGSGAGKMSLLGLTTCF